MNGGGSGARRKDVPQPAQPLKCFNWTKIPDNKVTGTIWTDIDDAKVRGGGGAGGRGEGSFVGEVRRST